MLNIHKAQDNSLYVQNLFTVVHYLCFFVFSINYQLLKEIIGSKPKNVFVLGILSSVQSLSHVWLFVTPWIAARQASLSITNSRSSHKLTSIKLVIPSSHLILSWPLLLQPPIPPSITVISNESTLHMRWPKYWRFGFSIILPKKSQGWSPLEWTGWISFWSKLEGHCFFFFSSKFLFSSVQFSHSVVFDSLWPHGLQHARPPYPSPTPRVFFKLMSIESVMTSNHHILCRPLLLLP